MKIYVKNMICESCKFVLVKVLEELDIAAEKIELGKIETKDDLTDDEKEKLNGKIKTVGLELLEERKDIIIDKIRKAIMDYVYHSDEKLNVNFSDFLSEKLNYNYGYLASLFSKVENNTIEQYVISLKIERIKELFILHEIPLSEIAYKLNYSSLAHLSNQFKKVTGFSPSHFKQRQGESMAFSK